MTDKIILGVVGVIGAATICVIANFIFGSSSNLNRDTSAASQPVPSTSPSAPTDTPSASDSSAGNSLYGGFKLPEIAGIIGANLQKGMSASYYEKEIISGVAAYDSNYRLTERDKQVIRNMGKLLESGRY